MAALGVEPACGVYLTRARSMVQVVGKLEDKLVVEDCLKPCYDPSALKVISTRDLLAQGWRVVSRP